MFRFFGSTLIIKIALYITLGIVVKAALAPLADMGISNNWAFWTVSILTAIIDLTSYATGVNNGIAMYLKLSNEDENGNLP
jgi:hypothetical protein